MPRIRTIKPEFWQDYQLARQLTRDQRLFYVGLWNESDDEGRFQAHPIRLRGALFPYDEDIHGAFIEDSLRALAQAGKLVLYEVSGEPYGELTNFRKHQKINRPTPSRIPPPPNDLEHPFGPFTEDSLSDHGGLIEDSRTEGKGRGKGKGSHTSYSAEFEKAWKAYPKRPNNNKRQAWKAWAARVREGVSYDDLMAGVELYAQYVQGNGRVGTEYVKQASTFFGPDRHWESEYTPTAGTNGNTYDTTPMTRLRPDWKPET